MQRTVSEELKLWYFPHSAFWWTGQWGGGYIPRPPLATLLDIGGIANLLSVTLHFAQHLKLANEQIEKKVLSVFSIVQKYSKQKVCELHRWNTIASILSSFSPSIKSLRMYLNQFKSFIILAVICRSVKRVGGANLRVIAPWQHSSFPRNVAAVASLELLLNEKNKKYQTPDSTSL